MSFYNSKSLLTKTVSLILSAFILTVSLSNAVYAEKSALNSVKETAGNLKNSALKGTNQAKDAVTNIANSAKDDVAGAYAETSKYISNIITKIDAQKFKNGWDTAAKFATANMSAQMGAAYVANVQNAITSAQQNIISSVNSNRTLASNTGFVAEEWHTSTFNIDAAARNSKYQAVRPESNGKASADVQLIKDGKVTQEIGLKYYKDGSKSAKVQSKTIMQNYNEYCAKADKSGSKKMSFNEYLDANVDLKEAYKVLDSEYASEYAGQTRLIPADQMDDAAAYLRKKIGKEAAKDGPNRKALSKSYQDTLDSLADKINAKDGTKSVPLTEDEAKALVDLCEKGEFDIEDFKDLKTSQVIKPKYILKQSMMAGTSAAMLQMALTVGPDVYVIIEEGIKNGYIDEKQLKEVGVDAAFAGANGFVEGAVSAALITACKAGKFGAAGKSLSPDAIGMMTVLTVDAIKYGYKLNKGEITTEQYGDIMAQEIFVSVIAGCTGIVFQTVLPFVPFAYLAGSMVGGMLASAAYESGKEVVMQVASGNGFEVVVPVEVENTINIGKDMVSSVDIAKVGKDITNTTISTTKDGLIKIKASKR